MPLALFVLGLFVGSFLLVLIDRIPRGETFLSGRSHCEYCKHKLSWYDLFPVFSYIALLGKCRYCHKKIRVKYPMVEITTGVMFVLTYSVSSITYHVLSINNLIYLCFLLFLVSAFIVIFFVDLWHGIIPDVVLIPTILVAFLYIILNTKYLILNHTLSAIGASLFFLIIVLATRGKGMGLGDVKFAFLMGLVLGFPKIIVGLYVAFLTGAFVSLILIVLHKKKFHGDSIAFGPFLVIGTFMSFFIGNLIWMRIFGA